MRPDLSSRQLFGSVSLSVILHVAHQPKDPLDAAKHACSTVEEDVADVAEEERMRAASDSVVSASGNCFERLCKD